ncbi:HK97 gp10 family phage protein [Aeromicrobium ponti]|uniref:HK97 gp10 family phage protein n=1 Tax=Cytobacillus oceanisediminis TaxID=665099 RepID=A0A562JW87_9BACI|nr:HK97-gp10 family putative phage morphogenesis protein [Cytobacillus oceanisediminis]TWH87460.1 HK97 gp10 family phage protein [Cytobacillus oceanisediminis]
MSVNVRGQRELIADLERRLGKERTQQISDRALKKGAQVFVRELKSQFEAFKDTGASIEEITVSNPMSVAGVRTIKIHWRGPKGRFRIIHLNEWGTVKNPNPRGKGVIARTMRNAENAYRQAVIQAIREGV